MPKQRELSGRIGRFKGRVGKNAGGNLFTLEIIHSPSNQLFRVYNPGEHFNSGATNDFRVNFGSTQLVPAGSSFDFFPNVNVNIGHKVATPGNDTLEQVRGLYDMISGDRESPSGRFEFNDTSRHTVVNFMLPPAGYKTHYRFLNAGENELKVFVGGTAVNVRTGEFLEKKRSVDVVVSTGNNIEVKCDTAPCKGIYELLRIWKE